MAIDKKQIFRVMFSGFGAGIGLDLANCFSQFLEKKNDGQKDKKDARYYSEVFDFLNSPMPEEYQQPTQSLIASLLKSKGKNCSFIPSLDEDTQEFIKEWNSAYNYALNEYRKITGNVFESLKRGAAFRQMHILNGLEYKRAIQAIKDVQAGQYKDLENYFEESFSMFEKNISYQESLEKMLTSRDMDYRISESGACPIDAFSMRIKSQQRISQKIARKYVKLADKSEECRLKKTKFVVVYDDLLLTDTFGFLMLKNRSQKLDDSIICQNTSLVTIEDSDIKETHKNKGQRQVKFIDTKTGIIYDYHMFRTLKDWVDNEFARKKLDMEKEVVPYEIYTRRELEDIIKKNPSVYYPMYGEIYNKCRSLLAKCRTTSPKESVFDMYSRLKPSLKIDFIESKKEVLLGDIKLFKNDIKRAKRKRCLTLSGLQSRVSELIACYKREVMRKYDLNLEELCVSRDNSSGEYEKIKGINNSVIGLTGGFRDINKNKFVEEEFNDFETCYSSLFWICSLNKEIEERYMNLKESLSNGFMEEDFLKGINYYKKILGDFSVKFPGESKIHIQTRFNIYKNLINTYHIFLEESKNPNRHESDGLPVSNLWNYMGQFSSFVESYKEKLSSSQLVEKDDVLNRFKF